MKKQTKQATRKQSDIFICKLDNGGYWVYPSPFVAHGKPLEIQFRNLTEDSFDIDLSELTAEARPFPLAASGTLLVTLDKAKPGLYEYKAAVKRGRAATTSRVKPIVAHAGSPPRIIVDA
jgi:hypothetical protein